MGPPTEHHIYWTLFFTNTRVDCSRGSCFPYASITAAMRRVVLEWRTKAMDVVNRKGGLELHCNSLRPTSFKLQHISSHLFCSADSHHSGQGDQATYIWQDGPPVTASDPSHQIAAQITLNKASLFLGGMKFSRLVTTHCGAHSDNCYRNMISPPPPSLHLECSHLRGDGDE